MFLDLLWKTHLIKILNVFPAEAACRQDVLINIKMPETTVRLWFRIKPRANLSQKCKVT